MRQTLNLERSLRYLLAFTPAAVLPAAARAQRSVPDAVLQSGTLSFTGHATVGDFVGSTTRVSGALIGGGEYSTTHGWVDATVSTLLTGNERRDRDLRASMEVNRYPTMHFDLTGATFVTSSFGSPDSTAMVLHGALSIHGVMHAVDLPATIVRRADTTRVASTFPLDLNDYAIGGLTKMFGLLRMQREIEVRVDLRFVDRAPVAAGR